MKISINKANELTGAPGWDCVDDNIYWNEKTGQLLCFQQKDKCAYLWNPNTPPKPIKTISCAKFLSILPAIKGVRRYRINKIEKIIELQCLSEDYSTIADIVDNTPTANWEVRVTTDPTDFHIRLAVLPSSRIPKNPR